MKKNFPLILVAIFCLLYYSCKKSSSGAGAPTTTTSGSGQWTLGGTTYAASIVSLQNYNGIGILVAYPVSIPNQIEILFGKSPIAGGTFTVLGMGPTVTDTIIGPSECYIQGVSSNIVYGSTGKAGDKVTVSVSGGNLTASFNTIAAASWDVSPVITTTTSGTLIYKIP